MSSPYPSSAMPQEDSTDAMGISSEQMEMIAAAAEAAKQQRLDVYAKLASFVEGKLSARMGTRKAKENQWLEAMRIYLGSLSSYNIVTGEYPFGTKNDSTLVHRPEVNIVRSKVNIAVAQTIAYQFAAGDKNWQFRVPAAYTLDPQEVQQMQQMYQNPQLSQDDIMQIRVDAMEREVETHLESTRYAAEARKAMYDWAILGTGILKGPLNAGTLKKVWQRQTTSEGKVLRIPTYTLQQNPLIYRVNPWYWFPDDTVTDSFKAEDSIEAHPKSMTEMAELRKHPGYFEDQIAECMKEDPRQYTNSPFNDPAYLTQGINLLKNKYFVLEYHGPVDKADLEAAGVTPDDVPGNKVYAEIWVCNGRVIRLQTANLEGCNHIPYYVATWEEDPASIFGFGIAMLGRDQQRVVNEVYKMLLDNAGVSAGPQVVVDTTIIQPADGQIECTPFKAWYLKEYGADVTKAIQFFMPPNAFEGLSALLQMSRGLHDEEVGVTLLQGSMGAPTAAQDNATGMAIKNENAEAPLFLKAEKWDDSITHPLLEAMYDWEMQYNEKDEIKCDIDIDVRSSTAYLRGVMDQQKLDRLSQEIAQGSPAARWVNLDDLTIARLSSMKLPSRGIVKSPQQVAQEDQQAAQQPPPPDPNMLKAQAAMQEAENNKLKIQLDGQRMQLEQQRHMEEMQLRWQTQHDTNQANIRTHELQVQQAGITAHATWAQGASSHDLGVKKLHTDISKAMIDNVTKKQLAGMDHVANAADIASKERIAREKHETDLRKAATNREAKQREAPNRNLTKHNPK